MALHNPHGVVVFKQDGLQGQGLPRFFPGLDYVTLMEMEARMATFEDWPAAMPQRPNDMAEAGFFYTGHGDQVKCFHCDIGVKNWTPTASPWEEHARWSSGCQYLVLNKGQAYVDVIKSRQQALELISQQEMRGNLVFLPYGYLVACSQHPASQWPGVVWVVSPLNPQAIQPDYNPPTIQPNFILPTTQANFNPPTIQHNFNPTEIPPKQPNPN